MVMQRRESRACIREDGPEEVPLPWRLTHARKPKDLAGEQSRKAAGPELHRHPGPRKKPSSCSGAPENGHAGSDNIIWPSEG